MKKVGVEVDVGELASITYLTVYAGSITTAAGAVSTPIDLGEVVQTYP